MEFPEFSPLSPLGRGAGGEGYGRPSRFIPLTPPLSPEGRGSMKYHRRPLPSKYPRIACAESSNGSSRSTA
jgi:hypothetical protein